MSAKSLVAYSAASVALLAGAVVYAFRQKNQHFFPSMVYLYESKMCTLAVGNFALCLAFLFSMMLKKVFLGNLRAQEVEVVNDKLKPAVMGMLFVMTIFHVQFNSSFIGGFLFLLFCKAAHWTAEERVKYMEQSPSENKLEYFRLLTFMFLLLILDVASVLYAVGYTKEHGSSLLILFGFEYGVLTVRMCEVIANFFLNLVSISRDAQWHQKGTYMLYLQFFASLLQSILYVVFFIVVYRYYGIPLHIVRSMWFTFLSFRRALAKLIIYRKATRDMDRRYPTATEEMLADDNICIVCRDEMELGEGKVLPCDHVLHKQCLMSWLQQDPSCPLCRQSVLIEDMERTNPERYHRVVAQRRQQQFEIQQRPQHEQQHHQQQHQAQHQQRQQQQPTPRHSPAPDVIQLQEQMDQMRTQLDFIQSLILTQMEQQQEAREAKEQKEEDDHLAELTPEEVRRRRLLNLSQ